MNLINEVIIKEVEVEGDIKLIADLANEIWHEYFPFILSKDQIDYMVDKFQSEKAIVNQMKQEGYRYYTLSIEDQLVGYFAFSEEENHKTLFLSKLYLHKAHRGKGYGTKVFAYLREYCIEKNLYKIWLTVNKYNEDTIKAYIKRGFVQTDMRVLDIGNGYVMDDYIMEWIV